MRKSTMRCPECAVKLSVSPDEAGKTGRCPRCGASIVITPDEAVFAVDTPLIPLIDGLLGRARLLQKWPEAFEAYLRVLARLGLVGMLMAGAVALLHMTVAAVRTDSMRAFLVGLGAALGAIVAHYIAARFITAARTLLRNNPREKATSEFMDCVGLVAMLGTVALTVFAIVEAVQAHSLLPLLWLALAVVVAHVMLCFLNPGETMNVRGTLHDATGGETALAIVRVVFRCALVLSPVLLALGVLVGTSAMIVVMVVGWLGGEMGTAAFELAGEVVLAAALAPLALYVAYIAVMWVVDFWSAVSQTMRNTGRMAR